MISCLAQEIKDHMPLSGEVFRQEDGWYLQFNEHPPLGPFASLNVAMEAWQTIMKIAAWWRESA